MREEHLVRLGDCLGRVGDSLHAAVQEGRITQERATEYSQHMTRLISQMPYRGVSRLHQHIQEYRWFQTQEDLIDHYHATGGDPDKRPPAFCEWEMPSGRGTLVLADHDDIGYNHEFAHAIDGPPGQGFTAVGGEFYQAYHLEKGNLDEREYPTSSTQEWWAELVSIALTDQDLWNELSQRPGLRRSTSFIQREIL